MTTSNDREENSLLRVPFILMMFVCIINFDILRNLKESMLIPRVGAEAIPFVKFWVVLPAAFCFLVTYSLLANRLSKRHLFTITLSPFLLWMPLFSQFIYPNLDYFLATELSDIFEEYLPESLLVISGLVKYWPVTLFYAISELWGAAVICILFWTSVNDSFNTESAKRFYPILTLVGNSASIFAGPLIIYCVTSQAEWQDSLNIFSVLFVVSGFVILGLHEYAFHIRRKSPSGTIVARKNKTATSLPFRESVSYLSSSPYLGFLALIMVSYCIAINLIEVAWKNQLVQLYPTEAGYSRFMGKLTFFYGIGCLLFGVLLSFLIRKGWNTAAIVTPFIMLVTGLPFFLASVFGQQLMSFFGMEHLNLLLIGVSLGMISVVFSKSAKYTFFDTTKEMAFVPLNDEQKYKGKAAIELIVSRLGKSGSSFILQFLIFYFGSLTVALPWIMGVFLVVFGLWIYSVCQLNKQYAEKSKINPLKNKTL